MKVTLGLSALLAGAAVLGSAVAQKREVAPDEGMNKVAAGVSYSCENGKGMSGAQLECSDGKPPVTNYYLSPN